MPELRPGAPQAVRLLEAAYRVDLGLSEWLEGMRAAFEPSAPGAAVTQACTYDISDGKHVRITAIVGGSEEHRRNFVASSERDASDYMGRVFQETAASRISSEMHGDEEGNRQFVRDIFPDSGGLIDGWGIMGGDVTGRGVMFGALTSSLVRPLSPGLRSMWDGVAAHVAAAFRLRESLAAGLSPGESVLSPGGQVLHAEGPARSVKAREALAHAVRGIDRARSRHGRHPREALDAWQALVVGRWTLLDQVESDGRRLLLARVNEVQAPARPALSERESQAVALAGQGWSNKQISYRLGVGEPTVSGHLKRASRKLGLKSRVELVRYAQSWPPVALG